MTTTTRVDARVLHAGVGLSTGTIQWGRRPDPAPAIGLTHRDLRLMALLHDVNFLSASQLLVLGWGTAGERAGQKRLKRLHDAGFVDRFRPIPERGSAEWNYRLTTQGWTALTEQGLVPNDRRYTPTAITSISYTEHDLQLAALVLHIARAAPPEQPGGLIDSMPFHWQGPRSGRIDPKRVAQLAEGQRAGEGGLPILQSMDEEFERSSAARLPQGTRLHPERSRAGYLEPDATLTGHAGEDQWAVLIEYDRTDRPHKQIDRLRRYDHWLLDGWRHSHFATHSIPPSVVYLTARERPLRRLIETADKTLTAWYGHENAGPREGTHPARERIVFTSRERILAGDWTMQRTPSLPPDLREDPTTCPPRSIQYSLPALFTTSG
jgi:hypothetical protein